MDSTGDSVHLVSHPFSDMRWWQSGAVSGVVDDLGNKSTGDVFGISSPIDGQHLAMVQGASREDYERVVSISLAAWGRWRLVPAPKRGQIIRQIGERIRQEKEKLATVISWEVGKTPSEALGEVQEAIDIIDFAVGLSRQLYGKTMHSERREHRMLEQWHPLGVVGVITAFNFPMAVWAWNAFIAAVCGDVVIWKPSEFGTLCSIALLDICTEVTRAAGHSGLFTLVATPGAEAGKWLAGDRRIPLVSATGSCAMGRSVAQTVAGRFGRCLLELGGNNAVIVMDDADLDVAVRATLFGALGTAGQRCTTTRRALVHTKVVDAFIERLRRAYASVCLGNPLEPGILVGPLISTSAAASFEAAVAQAQAEGGEIICGGKASKSLLSGRYVEPTLIRMPAQTAIVRQETFAPILYVMSINSLEEAIELHNDVPQGLSSAIFTTASSTAERFLSVAGSDCGIANVNVGTCGAEIGGAFGGEKETGGGRESGSDSWKQYMRRQTVTINYGSEMPLAQGVKFDVG